MSTVDIGEVKHEIIIVRRGHDDDEHGHHGGVWKIAFADFMTAMMCFFLVMWLINASSEQTKTALASYFNPVKLIDRNSSRKGLEDIGDGPHSSGDAAEVLEQSAAKVGAGGISTAGSTDAPRAADAAKKSQHSDESLFEDPYSILAEIAAETGTKQNISSKGDGGARISGPATGASGGESYRDPFAPDFWSQQVVAPSAAEASAERAATGSEAESRSEQAGLAAPSIDAPLEAVAEKEPAEMAAEEKKAEPEESAPSAADVEKAQQIKRQLAEAFEPGNKFHDGISVTATDEGVTISVTDQLEFGMFEIGSAVPRRELVLAMEKISKTIGAQRGTLTISGHTDGRPFKGGAYDNWRLSTARAHAAYYMLVRAGLDERRVTEVAGFADRKLKEAGQPMAASNRRIEILLEGGG